MHRARSSGCAAPTPRGRPGPPGMSRRRPCSRSSDEMVWRLFFTRWWISRIVASMETSRRSRRRSSETSRRSTSAPVTCPPSSRGRQRSSTLTSVPRSTSSVTGTPAGERGADRGGLQARARGAASPRRWRARPALCRAETALGEAYSTRPSASRTMAPSPTRGDSSASASSTAKGKVPAGDHRREPVEHPQIGALELAGLAGRWWCADSGSARRRSGPRDAPGCTAPGRADVGRSADLPLDEAARAPGVLHEREVARPDLIARRDPADRRSGWWWAGPGPTTTNWPRDWGTRRRRSAKQRSARGPQAATSRWRCAAWGVPRAVRARTSSATVAIRPGWQSSGRGGSHQAGVGSSGPGWQSSAGGSHHQAVLAVICVICTA